MKQGNPSITALISAFGRAYHSQLDSPKIFNDDLAIKMITEQEWHDIKQNMVQGISFFNEEIAEKYKGNTDELLKWITQVQLSPTTLARSAYCEQVLLNEVNLGLKQYVILGAGLDTFCFRHPELEHVADIFEIDAPAMQEVKKRRLAEANFSVPSNLHFVPMDFTKKFSYSNLFNEGFDYKKTFFSLLGVSYYLTKEELSSLLTQLFSEVPPGSSIVFDYADEGLFIEKGIFNRVENMVKLAETGGEPMKSCYSYSELERLLADAGLLIYEHLSPDQINEEYFQHRHDYLSAFETIHYIHAVKN